MNQEYQDACYLTGVFIQVILLIRNMAVSSKTQLQDKGPNTLGNLPSIQSRQHDEEISLANSKALPIESDQCA